MKRTFFAVVSAAFLLAGCAGAEDTQVTGSAIAAESFGTLPEVTETVPQTTTVEVTTESEEAVELTGLSFNDDAFSMNRGDEMNIRDILTVTPEDHYNFTTPLTYSVGGDSITVDENGMMSAVAVGTSIVTVTAGDFTDSCTVVVDSKLTGVHTDDQVLSFNPDLAVCFPWSMVPADATGEHSVTFSSDNESVLTIDATGTMHMLEVGEANVTVTLDDFTSTSKVTVTLHATDLAIVAESAIIYEGESLNLLPSLVPADTSDTLDDITYTSSDESVATVKDGIITAVKPGSALITVSSNGFTKTCNVLVPVKLTGIEFAENTLTLAAGGVHQAAVTAKPDNCTDAYTVAYASDNTAVATVTETGLITAVGAGTCNIVAAAGNCQAVMQVSVLSPLQGIYLNYNDVTISLGDTLQLGVGYVPADTTDDRTVTYASDNTAVATVNNAGVVTAVAVGSCNIVANCGGKTTLCVVRVKEKSLNQVVVLDPGHGGGDGGAHSAYTGANEKDLALKVALYCRDYLLNHYNGVDVYLTRETDTRYANNAHDDLTARVNYAQNLGASYYIALHFNSGGNGAYGAMCLVPSSTASAQYHAAANLLSNCILGQLIANCGLNNLGLLQSLNSSGYDYYFINRECAARGMTGIIVEHCFLDSPNDVAYYDSEADLVKLGQADAMGIAQFLGLTPKG